MILKQLDHAGLADVHAKIVAGQRLSSADGLSLYDCPDLTALGYLANLVREARHGDTTAPRHARTPRGVPPPRAPPPPRSGLSRRTNGR